MIALAARRRALQAMRVGIGLVMLGGCSLGSIGLKAPVAKVSEVSLKRVSASELVLVATLDVRNPNAVAIPIANLQFELDLLDRPFGEGRATQSLITLPADGVIEVPVEITVPTTRLIELLRALRPGSDGLLPYRIRGSAGWGSEALTLSFERRGEIDALAALREALRPWRRP